MQGLNDPSFLPTKKKPAPTGDEEARMIPVLSKEEMYSFIAALSGPEYGVLPPFGHGCARQHGFRLVKNLP